MPRPSRGQSTGAEANLARRIKYERERRGLSHEALAKLMTDAGCKIQGSAIYKIETPNKESGRQRRITVDELTAFAEVFETPVSDLLTDMELIDQRRASELVDQINECRKGIGTLAMDTFNALGALFDLAYENSELAEYVAHQLDASGGGRYTLHMGDDTEEDDAVTEAILLRMVKANGKHLDELRTAAKTWVAFRRGNWTDEQTAKAAAEAENLRAELGTETY